jgi:hypothetical protein
MLRPANKPHPTPTLGRDFIWIFWPEHACAGIALEPCSKQSLGTW